MPEIFEREEKLLKENLEEKKVRHIEAISQSTEKNVKTLKEIQKDIGEYVTNSNDNNVDMILELRMGRLWKERSELESKIDYYITILDAESYRKIFEKFPAIEYKKMSDDELYSLTKFLGSQTLKNWVIGRAREKLISPFEVVKEMLCKEAIIYESYNFSSKSGAICVDSGIEPNIYWLSFLEKGRLSVLLQVPRFKLTRDEVVFFSDFIIYKTIKEETVWVNNVYRFTPYGVEKFLENFLRWKQVEKVDSVDKWRMLEEEVEVLKEIARLRQIYQEMQKAAIKMNSETK